MKKVLVLYLFLVNVSFAQFNLKTIETTHSTNLNLRFINGCSSELLLSGISDFNIKNFWYKFFYSNDGGINWISIKNLEKFENLDYQFVNFLRHSLTDFTLFGNRFSTLIKDGDTTKITSGIILRSYDMCQSWIEEYLPDSISFSGIRMTDSRNGYILGKDYILKTNNKWESYSYHKALEMEADYNFYVSENGCYLGFRDEKLNYYFNLFRYSDSGDSILSHRVALELGIPHSRTRFKFNSFDTGMAFVEYSYPQSPPQNHLDIYRTEDSGYTWKQIYSFVENTANRNFLEYSSYDLIILISQNLFYISEDNGLKWQKYPSKLFNEQWFFSNKVYIVNQDSIYFADGQLRLIYRDKNMLVENLNLILKDNFSITPQPASHKLFLKSYIMDYINADISIFNGLGIKVFQTNKNIISNQENFIELNTLSTGLYFLVLKAGNQTVTRKFLILRD